MLPIIDYIIVFLISFSSNIFWGLYVKKVSQHKNMASANYSVIMSICFLTSLHYVINDFYSDIVYLIGVWIGTYFHSQMENIFHTIYKNIFKKENVGDIIISDDYVDELLHINNKEVVPMIKSKVNEEPERIMYGC
jgi:hypothetical protein